MRTVNQVKALTLKFVLILLTFVSCNRVTEKTDASVMPPDESLRLSEAQIQLANIKVDQVREGIIANTLSLTGSLKVNEQSSVSISSHSAGRVEKLFFKRSGERVNVGDSLYKFYSDELVIAEKEYSTLQVNNWNYLGQYPPSLLLENKLLFFGMLPSQLQKLKRDGKILFTVTILSQVKGTIRSVNVAEGQYVEAGEKLFDLAGDNTLWVEAQAYPGDLPGLNPGMPAKVTILSESPREIDTRISYINPVIKPGRNVIIVRSIIDNSDKKLFPGMLVKFNVETMINSGIIVPLSAVITDKYGSKVWIQDESGAFSDREVTTGIQSRDSVLILTGLERSDMVVTSGSYLLNSEMILKRGNSTGDMAEM